MKKLIYILMMLSYGILNSAELPFHIERMITDFRGASKLDNIVIAYGDYGIICGTGDKGENWWQVNIGDKYSIKRIISNDGIFYGVTNTSLIKSTDRAKTWTHYQAADTLNIIDMFIFEDDIYCLSSGGISIYDKNMKIKSLNYISLDTNSKYSELLIDSKYIYTISDSLKILRINKSSKEINLIEIPESQTCTDCRKLSRLKLYEDNIYIVSNNKNYQLKSVLLKSNNNGNNWTKVTGEIFKTDLYNVENDEIFVFNYYSGVNHNLLYSYCRVDNNESVKLNSTDTSERYFRYYDSMGGISKEMRACAHDIIRIDENILMIFGTYKSIIISKDNGMHWELKSIYDYNRELNEVTLYPLFVNKDKIFVFSKRKDVSSPNLTTEYYKTIDGGVTWLPQKISENYLSYSLYFQYYDSLGNGFNLFYENKADFVPVLSNDNGETYYLSEDTIKINKANLTFCESYYKSDDKIYFAIPIYGNKNNGGYTHTVLYEIDENKRVREKYRYDSLYFTSQILIENKIYAIARYMAAFDSSQVPNKFLIDYYCLLESTDNGKTFDQIDVKLPNYSIYREKLFKYKNYLLWGSGVLSNPLMLYYDMASKKLDSIKLGIQLNSSYNKFFEYEGDLFRINIDNSIERWINFEQDKTTTVKIDPSEIFGQWDNQIQNNTSKGRDQLHGVFNHGSNPYILIGSTDKSQIAKMNFAKIISNKPVSVEEIETNNDYLYISKPYPIPAKNQIQAKIYWDKGNEINEKNIGMYNIFGEEMKPKSMRLEIDDITSGNLYIDCSNLSNGTYMIKVKNETTQRGIPIVIAK